MKTKQVSYSQSALRGLGGAMLIAILSVFIYAAQAGGKVNFFNFLGVGVLLAGSSAFAGGALGFLFGIPRTLQQAGESSGTEGNHPRTDAGPPMHQIEYRVNTNLEQISDWLTKILVGVGLTQIAAIRTNLVSLTAFVAKGLGSQSQAQVFAFALITYSVVVGFLFGYLWTRLYLVSALRVADQAAIGNLAAKVDKAAEKADINERKLDELKEQANKDAAALNLAYRQLNPSSDLPQTSQDELNSAIASASKPVKVQIFNQAWQTRGDNWSDERNKPKMERTIPIFKALIADDVNDFYHMNHGQLGFALKDKLTPDWSDAEKELTKAIEIRGPWEQKGWLFYEFNRAVCRIMSDKAYQNDSPSDPDRRNQILEDLKSAVFSEALEKIILSDSAIQKWMQLNNVNKKDLDNTL